MMMDEWYDDDGDDDVDNDDYNDDGWWYDDDKWWFCWDLYSVIIFSMTCSDKYSIFTIWRDNMA